MTNIGLVLLTSVVVTGRATVSPTPRAPFKIVHLGDSYSAGNGARDDWGDRAYSPSVDGCYRSDWNWGRQFARSLEDVFAVTYINRACSGSTLAHITGEREMDSDWALGSCPTPDFPDEEFYREAGPLSCTRFLRPQILAIDEAVDLVLMTIGGNDVRFSRLVEQCFALGVRDPVGCRTAVDFARDEMAALRSELTATLGQIRALLKPTAKVVLVAYPHVMLNVRYLLEQGSNAYDARQEIRRLSELFDDDVHLAAVSAANRVDDSSFAVFFGETKRLFDGHEPHPEVDQRNPDRWVHEFEGTMPVEWYHFNALGHQELGAALSAFETFGAVGGTFEQGANIDLAYVIDTTGSMQDEIDEVRTNVAALVNQLAQSTSSFRVALVSFRDFPERTGKSVDYPARVDQSFTNNLPAIQHAIDALVADGGGDGPETVLSGIKTALDLPWRPGVTKVLIVIGDAPALVSSDGIEPISGLTTSQIVAESIALDPVETILVNRGSLASTPLRTIVEETGGSELNGRVNLTATLATVINVAARQPFAWFGAAIAGRIGIPILFDASGSYDPFGSSIELYEWGFNGNGSFDFATTEANTTFTYEQAFEGLVILRVTSQGGTALASARVVINEAGSAVQANDVPCELDANNFSIVVDDNGTSLDCNATNLPSADKPGLVVTAGNTSLTTTTTSTNTTSSTTTKVETTTQTSSTSTQEAVVDAAVQPYQPSLVLIVVAAFLLWWM